MGQFKFNFVLPSAPNRDKYKFFPVRVNSVGIATKFLKPLLKKKVFDREPDQIGESLFPLNIREGGTEPEGRIKFFWGETGEGFSELIIIDNCMCNVYRSKIINKTIINGKSGSISEYYGTEDYDITIHLQVFNNRADQLPQKQISQVIEMYENNTPIVVENNYLNNLGVEYIIIEDFDMKQSSSMNVQDITLYCSSDYVKIDN